MTIDRQSRRVLRGRRPLVPDLPAVQGPALLRAAGFGPRLLSGRRQSTGAQASFAGPRPSGPQSRTSWALGRESRCTQRAPEAQVAFRRLSSGCAGKRPCVRPKGKGPTETRTRIAGFRVQSADRYTVGTRPPRSPAAEPCGSQPRGPRPSRPPGALVTPPRAASSRRQGAPASPAAAASTALDAGE